MNKIEFYKIKDGKYERSLLESKKKNSQILSAEQSRELLGGNSINVSFTSSVPFDFSIGDKIVVFGESYFLNQMPQMTKVSNREYNYALCFEGIEMELMKALYISEFEIDGKTILQTQFDFTGNMKHFMELLLKNITRVLPGSWRFDGVEQTDKEGNISQFNPDETEAKTLSFSDENCLAVLQNLASEYGTEFAVEQTGALDYRIKIGKQGKIHENLSFSYGRARGLYKLTRSKLNDENAITRLYVSGGEQNIGVKYRGGKKKLCLPAADETGLFISEENSYIEHTGNREALGLIEGSVCFNDIYPKREGEVTGVLNSNHLLFYDDKMDFDINERDNYGSTKHLVAGETAKIHFNSGRLGGYEFELTDFNWDSKSFSIKAIEIEGGIMIPSGTNGAFKISEGDRYVIFGIVPPQNYFDAAEEKLLEKALEKFYELSCSQFQYSLELDENYLSKRIVGGENETVFSPGDYIHIKDDYLVKNKDGRSEDILRIISLTRNVLEPYRFNLTLGNSAERSIFEKVIEAKLNIDKIITVNRLNDITRAKMSWRNTEEIRSMVFDGDNYFDTEKIRPLSIETNMLSVGSKAGQFVLSVRFEVNYAGDENKVFTSGGALSHLAIENEVKDWFFNEKTAILDDDNAYYIYAVCSRKNALDAQIIFLDEQKKADEDPEYYYFSVGVTHSPENGVRWISLTYGTSSVNGRYIKTGRIQSGDGQTYFDLDSGAIHGNIEFTSSPQWDSVAGDIQKAQEDAVKALQAYEDTQDYLDGMLREELLSLQEQIDGQVESFFSEGDPENDNDPSRAWQNDDDRQKHLNDTFTNTSTGASWRWAKSGNRYLWVEIADTATSKALQIAGLAKDTADSKRRVFVVQPNTPYEVGDLWAQGGSGDIMRCKTARGSGSFSASDWEKATKYTDDSKVDNLKIGGVNLCLDSDTERISGNGYIDVLIPSNTFKPNTSYAWSFDAKTVNDKAASTASSFNVYHQGWKLPDGSYIDPMWGYYNIYSKVTSYYQRFSVTFKTPAVIPTTGHLDMSFYCGYKDAYNPVILLPAVRRWKLEEGNKATDWTPAINDMPLAFGYGTYSEMIEAAKKGKTIIKGGYINTSLVIAKEFSTAASGRRMSINYGGTNGSGDNSIKMYDNNDSRLLLISSNDMERGALSSGTAAISAWNLASVYNTSSYSGGVDIAAISVAALNNSVTIPQIRLYTNACGFSIDSRTEGYVSIRLLLNGSELARATSSLKPYGQVDDSKGSFTFAGFKTSLEKGVSKLRLEYEYNFARDHENSDGSEHLEASIAFPYGNLINIEYANRDTQIGANGFIVQSGSDRYFLAQRQGGGNMLMEMCNGDHFIRVSNSGVEGTGVIGGGNVYYGGGLSTFWGTKIISAVKTANGTYVISHSIGNTNYFVSANGIGYGVGFCTIGAKTNTSLTIYTYNSLGNLGNFSFDFIITGKHNR